MTSRGRCVCGVEDTPARVLKHYRSCETYANLFRTDAEAASRTPEENYALAHPASEPSVEGLLVVVLPRRARVRRPNTLTTVSAAPGLVVVERWGWEPTMLEEIPTSVGDLLTDQ